MFAHKKRPPLAAFFIPMGTNPRKSPSNRQLEEKEEFPMKRLRAILCALLAGALLAGCGKVEEGGRSERPEPAMELAKYIGAEAENPV